MATSFEPDDGWPPLDARLVKPGTRYEMLDGKLIYVSPADAPHAERHSQLAALLEAHVAADFQVSVDMLTRTSKKSDIAPDATVSPRARDPVTGTRQLMHLAFEIASTQGLAYVGRKARSLATRGVRRVFAIQITKSRVLEWSEERDDWTVLDRAAVIADPALAVPLPISALATAIRADVAMAKALLAKRNPVFLAERAGGRAEGRAKGLAEGRAKGRAEGRAKGLAEGRAKGLTEGRAKGRAEGHTKGRAEGRAAGIADERARVIPTAVLAIVGARGLHVSAKQRATITGERDPGRLDAWLARAGACATVAELVGKR